MATFLQWNAKRPLKRIAWVCGPEQALREEVHRAYDRVVPDRGTWCFSAGGHPEQQIWDSVLTIPPSGASRTMVFNAEKLLQTQNFAILAAAPGMDMCFTVFFSNEDDFTRAEQDGKRVLAPHLAVLRDSKDAQIIRCCAPGREEDQVALVASWWPGAGKNIAYEVLSRSGGSLLYAWQACDKAVRARMEPTLESAGLVTVVMPGREFADYLVAGDKKAAVAAARHLQGSEVGAALGILAYRLGALESIAAGKASGWNQEDLAVRLKLDRRTLRELSPHAAQYSPGQVSRRREVLAVTESAWRSGVRDGVLEAAAALW